MSSSSLKIVLDTNQLWGFSKKLGITSFDLDDLVGFIKNPKIKNVSLWVPEVVLKELIQQRKEKALGKLKRIEEAVEILKPLGIKVSQSNPTKDDLMDKIKKGITKNFKNLSIGIIRTPKIKLDEILERAISGTSPFQKRVGDGEDKQNTDKGFKDTVIWFSILEDAKNNKGVDYVVVTNDSTLSDSLGSDLKIEFKEKTKTENLEILRNVVELKEYLDKRFVLRLGLSSIFEDIEQEVKAKIGDIMLEFNKQMNTRNSYFGNLDLSWAGVMGAEEEPMWFNCLGLEISDIAPSDKKDRFWSISASLTAESHKLPHESLSSMGAITASSGMHHLYSSFGDSQIKTYPIKIVYDRYAKQISKLDVERWASF